MTSEPPLAEETSHTLTRNGESVSRRFIVGSSSIKFNDVNTNDSGIYTISFENRHGKETICGKETIELCITESKKGELSPHLITFRDIKKTD